MNLNNILFNPAGDAVPPNEISKKIDRFGYNDAVYKTIQESKELDRNGEVFIRCTARILSNFGMSRSGPFKNVNIDNSGNINGREKLLECWKEVGDSVIEVNKSILVSGYSRGRYLLEINKRECDKLIAKIWSIMKQLLPFTMGETSYGLVGASKILFAVLPEIVLPIDNTQWLKVFKTVDIGDVINRMVNETQHWETVTGEKLNELDHLGKLTTLPSVYNVMAMAARPNKKGE
ncbi:hypothetical protein [Dehalococcoides mccartyi]|uniref:hypothetical protein n=1 Tax=Dehalococcoides mccartyi TaxID=61435 RepID=UPI002FCA74DC